MQRKNNIVLRLHRQRKPEQVLLPLVREDNGEALRVILEKQDNVTAEFIYRTEKKVRSGWLKLEIEQDGCRRSDNLEEELPVILEVETDIRPEAMTAMYLLNDWWTRPAFINDFSEIPELTQAIYGKLRNGYFFLLPMPGKQFKTQVKPGRENTLIFGMSACKGGISKLDEPVLCICGGGQSAGSGSCVYGLGGRVSRNPFERGTEYAGDAEISWLVQLGCILYGDQ